MYISITLKLGDDSFDIQVDDRQTAGSVLEVLKESGIYNGKTQIDFFKSKMKKDLISGYVTLGEQNVLKGDHLTAVI